MAGIQATGVGSNLDVTGLVEKLMEVERKPLTALDTKEAAVQVKISAYATFKSSLSAFQGTLQALADPSNYQVSKGTVEDTSVASASTSANAAAGSYSLEVTNLAKAQKLASGTFTSITDTVGTGTLTFQYGTHDPAAMPAPTWTLNGNRATQTVTIDAAHSSLSGVRDAINAANIGVSANIVNDGSGFRLVVSSKDTGAANGIKISVADGDLDDSNQMGLSKLAYDPIGTADAGKNMSQIMAAENATMYVDGLLVTKSSNTVSDVIAGTTLTLLKKNTGSPTKLTIASDQTAVMTSVDNFVKAYNDLNKTIGDLTKYNAATKTAATLQGDPALRSIAADIRDGLTSMVSGAVGNFKGLPQVGISFDRNGNLTVDKSKLTAALKADATAVQSLFSTAAVVDDSLVTYAGGTSATKAGNYGVDVSQIATRGTLAGVGAAGLIIDGTNDTLNVTVNGTSATVKLAQATYASHAALLAEMQSKINGSSALQAAKAAVTIAESSGVFTVTSGTYGSTSNVTISGNGAANVFGGTPTAVAGVDVVGTIGGQLATGVGQRLTGTGAAAGLKLDVLGGLTGSRGSVKYGVGVAGQLDQMITKLVASKGLLASRTESLQSQVKQIDSDRTALIERLENTEQRYKTQFSSLDQTLTNMQSMSSYLAQQLASIKSSG